MSSVHTEYAQGMRVYVDDSTQMTVPGVTSIINMLPKPFLQRWNANMAATLAVDSPFLAAMAASDREGAIKYIAGAAQRYTKERGRIGSEAHMIFERLMNGEHVGQQAPDIEPYRLHFLDFMEKVNPELVDAENAAWSDTHEYCGSFDAVLRVWLDEKRRPVPTRDKGSAPALLILDYKTSKGAYPDVALQLAAYANADRIIDADGDSKPNYEYDGGAVLHVTPERWQLKPVNIGAEVFDTFLTLKKIMEWDKNTSKKALGRPIAQSGRLTTGTERRAR